MSRPKSKKTRRPAKGGAAKHKAKPLKKGVSAKASNWLHARARSVRHGHQPRTVAIAILSGMMSTVLLGLWLSGHLGDAYMSSVKFGENRLLDAGFGIDHIEVSGARNASVEEVRQVLRIEPGELVFAVDLEAARLRVESLGWVHQASVTRLLPNRISVVITERTPYAIWQYNQKFSIISAAGEQIETAEPSAYSSLPLIVGQGADQNAAKVLARFATYREFSGKVYSLTRISNRRWNVQFQSGSELYLPAEKWATTIESVASSEQIMAMLDLPGLVVDARIPGKLAVHRKRSDLADARS
jgi:cell division protein FtsQ